MAGERCADCGSRKVFALKYCEKCWCKRYKCRTCGKPLTNPFDMKDIFLADSGSKPFARMMCIDCQTVGREINSRLGKF